MKKELKEEKSDYEILKNKINNLKTKNSLNSILKKEQIIPLTQNSLHKNIKTKRKLRPFSNYLPKYKRNKIIKPTNINNYHLLALEYKNNEKNNKKEENSKIFSMYDKEVNTTYIKNKTSNDINLINEFNFSGASNFINQNQRNINIKINKEYLPTNPIKRTKSNFSYSKKKIIKNIFNIKKNRYLSPKIYVGSKSKNIFSTEKKNNRCVSPSTANNSNINTNNNSFSSHFIFSNSLIANNFQRNFKNNLFHESGSNNITSKIQNINGEIISNINKNNNKRLTVIEYELNKLLAKKEKQNTMNNINNKDKIFNKNESFNVEEIYLNYVKKIDEISQKESFIQNKYNTNSNKKEKNKNTNKNIEYISSTNFKTYSNSNRYKKTNIRKNNTSDNFKYKLLLSNNFENKKYKNKKFSNPKIKYSFLNQIINNITRKINFIEKSSEKELELDITRIINDEFFINSNNIYDKNVNNKDFITYGYELTPERILKIKQINKDYIRKKMQKENNKEQQIKRIKRPTSCFYLSQKKNCVLYKNNKIKNKKEEAKYINKERINNNFENNENNINDKIYSLIDKKIEFTRNNLELDFYTQTQIKTNQNINEFLGNSSNRNKLNWNLISESDKEKGKLLWKKLTKIEPKNANNSAKNDKKKENKCIILNYNIFNNYLKENRNENDFNKTNKEKNKTRNYDIIQSYYSERMNRPVFGENKNDLKNCGLNEESEEESDDIENNELKTKNQKSENTQEIKVRKNQKRFSTKNIEKLENVQKIQNKKDFSNKKNNNNNNTMEYSKISEDDDEEEEAEQNYLNKNIRKNVTKKNKIVKNKIYSEKYKNKIIDNNKNKQIEKEINKNRINNKKKTNPKQKKEILSIKKLNKNSYIKNRNQDLMGLSNCSYNKSNYKNKAKSQNFFHNYKIKIKYNHKKKSNKKHKDKNMSKQNKEELFEDNISLNSSDYLPNKCQSLILENNKIYNNFLKQEIFSNEEKQNLSDENNEKNEEIILKNIRKKIVKLNIIKKKNKPGLLFDELIKNIKGKYKESEEMDKYYNDIFSKYGKEENDELVEVLIFGIGLKIKKKTQKNFYGKFISTIKKQNKIKREQSHSNYRLSVILDKFNKNNDEENDNKNIQRRRKRKNKTNNFHKNNFLFPIKILEPELPKPKEENEYKKDFFWGVKIDSLKDVEKKKQEALLRLKHDIKYKIKEGVFNQSEMDNFLKFQKRINELTLERINNRVYIKQLEEGFNTFEEELKIHEEKKKNERRINEFIDSMNFDLYRRDELQKAIEKYFCHPIDFKNKNLINILSPFRIDENKQKI